MDRINFMEMLVAPFLANSALFFNFFSDNSCTDGLNELSEYSPLNIHNIETRSRLHFTESSILKIILVDELRILPGK